MFKSLVRVFSYGVLALLVRPELKP